MKTKLLTLLLILGIAAPLMAANKKKILKTAAHTPKKTTSKVIDAPASKPKMSAKLQAWLKDLRKKLDRSNTQSKQLVAVAAVRGSDQPDAPPLYWKGKSSEEKIAGSEAADFGNAVDAAMNGDNVAAKEKLQSFVTTYPHSPLVAEANETLSRLDTDSVQP